MARKIPTIKLVVWQTGNTTQWEVINITDSLDYSPGAYLNRETVNQLCTSPRWKVSIGKRNA